MLPNNRPRHLPDGIKCIKCPYYLGLIKCIVSPCRECILSGRKTHPYEQFKTEKRSK